MQYGRIACLDKDISRLVVGADWFQEAHEDAAVAVLDAFAEAGGNCIDMAHIYGGGQGQRIVGRWMKDRGNRSQMVLLDKGCHPLEGRARLTREDMASDVAENLERLQVDRIDLFALHRDDPSVPAGSVIEWMNEHVAAGRISAFGASNWTTSRVAEANDWAASNGLQGFSMNNPNLSLATVNEPHWEGCVTIDRPGRDWHERTQFPLFSWASQGGGFFAWEPPPLGAQREGEGGERSEPGWGSGLPPLPDEWRGEGAGGEGLSDDQRRVYLNEENLARHARASSLAAEKGVSRLNIVLAWVLCQPFPTFALIGPRKVEELNSSLPALYVLISPEEMRWLEEG